MQLRIRQSGRYYFVHLNDNSDIELNGAWEANWFKHKCLFYDKKNILSLQVESSFRLDFWNMMYHITLPKLQIDSYLKPIRLFKGHWQLVNGLDTYDFYLHRGHKKSLFKNGTQIASYNKTKFNLFESDSFLIKCNDDENIELIISFELCFDLRTTNNGTTVSLDFGNLSKGVREFDHTWRPNEN